MARIKWRHYLRTSNVRLYMADDNTFWLGTNGTCWQIGSEAAAQLQASQRKADQRWIRITESKDLIGSMA